MVGKPELCSISTAFSRLPVYTVQKHLGIFHEEQESVRPILIGQQLLLTRPSRILFFGGGGVYWDSSHIPLFSYVHVLSCFSCVWLFVMLWTVACQAPLTMGFSRQEYWSGLPLSPPGDLPNPETEPTSLTSPVLAGSFFTTSATWEAQL